jgi:hypothetical protein
MIGSVVIQGVVGDCEAPGLLLAAQRLSETLGAASGETFHVGCSVVSSTDGVNRSGNPTIVITSMLNEVEDIGGPWPEVEERLRRRHLALAEDDRLIVYLLTVFRHVPAENDIARAKDRRRRIRKLNLLAAELSRETGLFVIDIDRVLADIGARALATDYRLSGPFAADAVSKTIATTLLTTGFDAFAAFEVQEAALAALTSEPISRASAVAARPVIASNTLVVRSGRRSQRAETVGRKQEQVGSYVRQVLTRRIGLRDAAKTVSDVIARHGLWYCIALVGREANRAVRNRTAPRALP